MFQPAIKWSGSKRSQCEEIVKHFPKEFDTYYEPFCGGCSVLRAVIECEDIKVNNYVCSDSNMDLINLWLMIKANPKAVIAEYAKMWKELNQSEDIEQQKKYYEKIREKFNKEKNPFHFMFLNRTCFNGLIRYNQRGEFNTPFHISRLGIKPNTFDKIINEWSELINEKNVTFQVMTYRLVFPKENDFMYLDPPYANTKGMYGGDFNNTFFLSG